MRIKADRIKETEKEIKEIIKSTKDARVWQRAQMLILMKKEKSLKEISEILDKPYETVRGWWKRYKKEGIGVLKLNYKGKKPYLTKEAEEELKEKLKDGSYKTLKEIKEFIKERYNVEYKEKSVSALLKRLKIKKKRTKSKK